MTKFVNTPPLAQLPKIVPIFPLTGTLLLPGAQLPLHIFEERYCDLVSDSLAGTRIFGMIQPLDSKADEATPPLYNIGSVGRIVAFRETEDGRYYITLHGICRFKSCGEVITSKTYREVDVDYAPFGTDLESEEGDKKLLDRSTLIPALKKFLSLYDVKVDWDGLDEVSDTALIQSLSMACPFEPREKQVLLEAQNSAERGALLSSLIEMAVMSQSGTDEKQTLQ